MKPIVRATGTTESEQYLVRIAEKAFLDLWSYPNVYVDKRQHGKGDGKELCDLLVVCGNDVLIFSDKSCDWPPGDDLVLSWRRWYRRSIRKAVDQIRGAQRMLEQFPDRLYLDPKCTNPFPLQLPSRDSMRVHGIVVARNTSGISRRHFGGGSGSLMISPPIKGDQHDKTENVVPLTIGDVDPDGPFVHVLDEAALDIVLNELDTITDLTEYLRRKEAFIRSGRLVTAAGEEALLAYYLVHTNESGDHDFVRPDHHAWEPGETISISDQVYLDLLSNPQYRAKKQADKISYAWDRLIRTFTENMLAGTSVVPEGQENHLGGHERAIRHLALVPRFVRREYASGVLDAMERGRETDRFTRVFITGLGSPDPDTAFFFMTLAYPKHELNEGYAQYRKVRSYMLEIYALGVLRRNRQLKRAIGIATEPPKKPGETRGSSEDLIYVEQMAWTDDEVARQADNEGKFNMFEEGKYKESRREFREYSRDTPEPQVRLVPATLGGPNRKQRRVMRAKARHK